MGKRIEQVIGNAQPVLLSPFYSSKNVQKGDHVSEISLVIAYEQHFAGREVADMFSSFDVQAVKDDQSRVRENTHNGIDYFSQQPG